MQIRSAGSIAHFPYQYFPIPFGKLYYLWCIMVRTQNRLRQGLLQSVMLQQLLAGAKIPNAERVTGKAGQSQKQIVLTETQVHEGDLFS